MLEADLPAADHVMRVAFGTFLGLPDPGSFMGDASYVANRWKADPKAAFTAVLDGKVVGSVFAARWGSVGLFGPLTVKPELWDQGIGRRLLDPVMSLFETDRVTHAGLFTFAQSPKHVGFYQSLGFWPGHLTAIMVCEIRPTADTQWIPLGRGATERTARMEICRRIADQQYPGLDLTSEIEATTSVGLGETVLLQESGEVVGFAICHVGPGTEAGTGACYVKFAAVRPGKDAAHRFEQLLDGCAGFGASRGAKVLIAGVSTARREAYRLLLTRGFRTVLQGVTMHRPSEPAYCRPELFVIDDWR